MLESEKELRRHICQAPLEFRIYKAEQSALMLMAKYEIRPVLRSVHALQVPTEEILTRLQDQGDKTATILLVERDKFTEILEAEEISTLTGYEYPLEMLGKARSYVRCWFNPTRDVRVLSSLPEQKFMDISGDLLVTQGEIDVISGKEVEAFTVRTSINDFPQSIDMVL